MTYRGTKRQDYQDVQQHPTAYLHNLVLSGHAALAARIMPSATNPAHSALDELRAICTLNTALYANLSSITMSPIVKLQTEAYADAES